MPLIVFHRTGGLALPATARPRRPPQVLGRAGEACRARVVGRTAYANAGPGLKSSRIPRLKDSRVPRLKGFRV
ncbi:hypothetical protein GCM10009850_089030 [Nonomuraea monospora]|uniref:Uncharacterized protein n=1 Tax=Nonomuraea monospora TaxID=568818 RepID=A0ABN3CVP6_9ACTN